MKQLTLSILLLASLSGFAQNPAPAGPQTRAIALTGATIHVGNGQVINNGVILFDKGIITAVGDGNTPTNGAEVINVAGKHVYPSIISPASTVGLQEISAVRATVDFQETGFINPNIRSLIAYNTDSEVIPTIRNNGLLLTQVMPMGGVISGSSSVVQSDSWNWEDAVLKADDGIWLTWPGYFARSFDFEDFSVSLKKNEQRQESINALKATFADAVAYAALKNPAPKNLKFESMKGLFDGTKNLYIRADYGKDIIEAIKFAKQMGIRKPVIVGGEDAGRVIDFLKENNVAVILGPMHRLPNLQDEDVYLPYKLPGMLQKAGIAVSLSYDGAYWRTRNLPFQAGTAAGFGGIDKEDALKMITSTTAKIMGIDNVVGTLEKGKHATLVVSKGDLLDMRTNVIEHAYIQGRHINLDDKHKRLYHMYREKYGQPDLGK